MLAAGCIAILGLVSAQMPAGEQAPHGAAARASIRLQVVNTVPLPDQMLETAIEEDRRTRGTSGSRLSSAMPSSTNRVIPIGTGGDNWRGWSSPGGCPVR
jgi:hypothetical protein